MKADNPLKSLLASSTPGVDASFLAGVMNKVNALPRRSPVYTPLVSARIRKHFIALLLMVAAAIILLCLFTLLKGVLPAWLDQLPAFTGQYELYYQFLALFTLICLANFCWQYRVQRFKQRHS